MKICNNTIRTIKLGAIAASIALLSVTNANATYYIGDDWQGQNLVARDWDYSAVPSEGNIYTNSETVEFRAENTDILRKLHFKSKASSSLIISAINPLHRSNDSSKIANNRNITISLDNILLAPGSTISGWATTLSSSTSINITRGSYLTDELAESFSYNSSTFFIGKSGLLNFAVGSIFSTVFTDTNGFTVIASKLLSVYTFSPPPTPPNPVPLPSSILFFGTGLTALAGTRRKRRKEYKE